MNISNLRDQSDFEPKKEDSGSRRKITPQPNFTTSSWSRLKDPRIVRVSRALGGKDRHSKVCTVRGLRDRRVRLSVPTAIQLYDLQDRLGLNQPSKVVDWLLDVAKHEIDELPPLQMPPGSNFGQGLQAMLGDSSHLSGKIEGISRENQERDDEEEGNKHDHHGTFVQSSNFFTRQNQNHSSVPGLFNNVVPNGSFLKWDPSNLSLSQFGSYEPIVPHQQDDNVHNFNMNPSGSHLFLYPPPPPQTQSYFPNSHDHNSTDFDFKQLNFQMLSSSSTSQNPLSSSSNFTPPLYTINHGMKPFQLSMNPKFFSSHEANDNEQNK